MGYPAIDYYTCGRQAKQALKQGNQTMYNEELKRFEGMLSIEASDVDAANARISFRNGYNSI